VARSWKSSPLLPKKYTLLWSKAEGADPPQGYERDARYNTPCSRQTWEKFPMEPTSEGNRSWHIQNLTCLAGKPLCLVYGQGIHTLARATCNINLMSRRITPRREFPQLQGGHTDSPEGNGHVANHPRPVEHRGTLSLDDKYQSTPRNVCIIPFRRNRMSRNGYPRQ
jgi:hypothetical protein